MTSPDFPSNKAGALLSARAAAKWFLLTVPVAAAIGSACAFFLWSLDRVTETFWRHPALLFLLPVAGVFVAFVYKRVGASAEGGNNLILDRIHAPGGGVPARMAPLVLGATLLTHLFGGSAGREGTAVQMGGSIASSWARALRLGPEDIRILLMAGVAAGFGGVFGTPIAGAVFAMEVATVGRLSTDALIPCLLGAVVGDQACHAWGVRHEDYHQAIRFAAGMEWGLTAKVLLASVVFGLAGILFSRLAHGSQRVFNRIPSPLLRPLVGGFLVIGLTTLPGTRDYLGLGVQSPPGIEAVTISSAFQPGGAAPFSWWWKSLFTAVTLGSGFKGGEVTPLFYIGSTLGNVLAGLLNAPVDLLAGLGFVAVFAGAANTPLACTLMGMELFGAQHAVYFAVACFTAYLFSGSSGIYAAQRFAAPKAPGGPERSLR